ncbi:MAG: hypothetical protein WCR46_22555 [Deltaproteobacteria bacterium]
MGKPLRLLIVEDSEDDALLMILALEKGGYDPVHERVKILWLCARLFWRSPGMSFYAITRCLNSTVHPPSPF